MKNPVVAGLVLGAAVLMNSCPQTAVSNSYADLDSGEFWARNYATGEFYTVESVQLAEGDKCVVWAEKAPKKRARVSVDTGRAIAREYDANIYDKIVTVFGSDELMAEGDVDGDGKLTLLLLDIEDDFNGSGAYTAGYFFRNDLYQSSNSNKRDMIYVDIYPSTLRSKESYATIAHELQHFINHVAHAPGSGMDTWIDEGLSAAAEYIYLGAHHEERVAQFSQSETVQQGNNFFVWDEGISETLLDDYSTVYLFFQWLRIQSGGTGIYREIITSPYVDYRAVTGAISGDFAAALGSTDWETTLRSWFAANYINSPTGLYGYHNELPTLQVYALGGRSSRPGVSSQSSVSLLPGEGVYSIASDSGDTLPSSSGNIRYAGLHKDGSSPESSVSLDTLYPNERLLTFNSNNNNKDTKQETGRLTRKAGETIPSSTTGGRSAGQAGNVWVIDARDLMGRGDRGGN